VALRLAALANDLRQEIGRAVAVPSVSERPECGGEPFVEKDDGHMFIDLQRLEGWHGSSP
jgi:hypothetical protein